MARRSYLRGEGYEHARWRSPGQRTGGARKFVSPARVIAETKRVREVMVDQIDGLRS